jgi:hypothetical protein
MSTIDTLIRVNRWKVKRYGIADANRQKRDRMTAERRQRIVQDEVALQVYRHRNEARS